MFGPFPNPNKSPLGPQKVKNDPKIKSKSNVRIYGNIENESCLTTWVDHKTVFGPFPNPKNSLLGAQKVKNDPEIESKPNVRIEKKQRKWKLFNYINRPQNSCRTLLQPQN